MCDFFCLRQAADIPANIHELALPICGENTIGQTRKFDFEVFVAHWVIEAADGVFDKFVKTAAVFGGESDSDLVFVKRGIDCGRNTVAQRRNSPVSNGAIAKLIDAAIAFNERDTRRMVDAEFSFEAFAATSYW